jgi:hypothetical protein
MFTVKAIDPSGAEVIYATDRVRLDPGYNLHFVPTDSPITEEISRGTVYVMNEAGKTVAKYELGQEAQQSQLDANGDPIWPGLYTNADHSVTLTQPSAAVTQKQHQKKK